MVAVLRHGARGVLRYKEALQLVGEVARLTGVVDVVHKRFALLQVFMERLTRELCLEVHRQNCVFLVENPLTFVQLQQTHRRGVDEDIVPEAPPLGQLDLRGVVEEGAEHAQGLMIRGFYTKFSTTIT